ncbi:MAG TPA: DNA polymerase III subunit alpha [Pseudogracilibacillus sp.]|nr:DNA polymerase III subunit alpha [Pseudogracilibacillus sp.]
MPFTHLQVRSGYSFYESTMTVDKLIARARQLNCPALALTDEGVLYGAISFYQTCKRYGIKPVIGMQVTIELEEFSSSVSAVLLAKSNKGYQHLIALSTAIQLNNACTLSLLEDHQEDLFCIVSSSDPAVDQWITQGSYTALQQLYETLKASISAKNLYLGMEFYKETDNSAFVEKVRSIQENTSFTLVAHHDARYAEQNDQLSYDCLQAMKQGKKWQPSPDKNIRGEHHLRSDEEMQKLFLDVPELLEANEHIMRCCSVELNFNQRLLPAFPVPGKQSASDYLKKLCHDLLKDKYKERRQEAEKRLDYELAIIDELAFSDYFLIVQDFVQFAKEQQIVVGPGRGSAAGSIVAYVLGITNVDPLKYDLLFERFLNPERVTMPDIDIDFSDVRREEIIEYIREKYGEEHVAQIITFGTFQARSLMRELMKVMEVDDRDQAYILKHIGLPADQPIASFVQASPEFATYIKSSNVLRTLFKIAVTIEGLPRHMSTHAAGVVIGKENLLADVPLTKGSTNSYLTQYAMHELESIGLLKMDILGLRNLTLIERIVQSIQRAEKITIDVENLPETDEATFALLQKGKTNGVFQLESAGMKQVLTRLQPTSLADIIALNALYRPGPMDQIPAYINRKHGKEAITYLHPDLQSILEPTYGVLVYQEQIMQVAHQFAGLSLGQADILRRAIGDKNHELIQEQKETFVQGCKAKNYPTAIAEEMFSWIYKFADYGFNKSHSVAYSKISYQLSYLKAHYPTYFFAQLFSTAMNDALKLRTYMREANELGIQMLPPSLNQSFAYFRVEGSHVRTGLMAIKGIGYETVRLIIEARKQGAFSNLFDFCLRLKNLKRKTIETLILAGVFDETYDNRASLLASIDQALDYAELFGDQHELFPPEMEMKPNYVSKEDFPSIKKLQDEKDLLQMYVSKHPLQEYRRRLSMNGYTAISAVFELPEKRAVHMITVLQSMKKIRTKRGDSMAFLEIGDETGDLDAVLFPQQFREVSATLTEETFIALEGNVSVRQGKKQLIINRISSVDLGDIQHYAKAHLFIRMTKDIEEKAALEFLQKAARLYPGEHIVFVHHEADKRTYKLGKQYNLADKKDMMPFLQAYFGEENVVFDA